MAILETLSTGQEFSYTKLTPEEMQKRGILGRITGPIADFTNPTRNGRRYGEKLWDTVFNDPLFQEKIDNKCVFGELGHPADRQETDMSKICCCLAEIPKKKDGMLYGVFDILNTPNGNILKSMLDYGVTIGVSSRGSGDLITDFDGQEAVDPDSYQCEGWDVVLLPAVKAARMKSVMESLESKPDLNTYLAESIKKIDEKDRQVVKESLNALGILLNEDLFVEGVANRLTPGNPYMLRNDGVLLTCDKDFHPYLFVSDVLESPGFSENLSYILHMLKDCGFETLTWFFENTNDNEVRKHINMLLTSLVLDEMADFNESDAKSIISNWQKTDRFANDTSALAGLVKQLSMALNQEFCRVRVGDSHIGGASNDVYFRISSVKYNWFDNIYKVVAENKHLINTVTICKDIDTFGTEECYKHNGVVFDALPVDKFLTISGNPIIESYTKAHTDKLNKIVNSLMRKESLFETWFNHCSPRLIGSTIHCLYKLNNEDYEGYENKYSLNEEISEDGINAEISDNNTPNEPIENTSESAVDNNEAMIEELQEALKLNRTLDSKVVSLNEKLSVSYAKEMKLEEEVATLREQLARLQKKTNEQSNLNEKLESMNEEFSNKEASLNESLQKTRAQRKALSERLDSETKRLTESIAQKDVQIQELNEKLSKASKVNSKNTAMIESLQDEVETTKKDNVLIKENYSKKLDKSNQLVEKYKGIAKNAVNKYIESQAIRLGVKPQEIKNRLPESYGFTDIDSICESLRKFQVNLNNLPFDGRLNEGIKVSAISQPQQSILPQNKEDMINDFDLGLIKNFI